MEVLVTQATIGTHLHNVLAGEEGSDGSDGTVVGPFAQNK